MHARVKKLQEKYDAAFGKDMDSKVCFVLAALRKP